MITTIDGLTFFTNSATESASSEFVGADVALRDDFALLKTVRLRGGREHQVDVVAVALAVVATLPLLPALQRALAGLADHPESV